MKKYILILGDLLAIAILNLIGFASHRELGAGASGPDYLLPRMAAIFFPLALSWFVLASALGLFQREVTLDPKQLWRPALAAFFAAPLATVLRGLLLNAPIIPTFPMVLGATSALGMTVWRVLYFLLNRNIKP